MYTVTSDFVHYLTLKCREEAIRLADNIKGYVYIRYPHRMDFVYCYQYDGQDITKYIHEQLEQRANKLWWPS